jgi:hypothetical protein
MRRSAAPTILSLLLVASVQATTWTIGPGQTYTLPSQVSTLVGNGDTVNIEAGVYPSDVARWQADDLVLRGVGGMAHLESNGNAWGGKAIWVIQGDNTTVEWIEFSECTVPDQNGAGIRQEGLNLTVHHCYFHHNENGILAGTVNPSSIRIEHCEFAYNGFGDGQSHNLYINNVDSLTFRYNYSHHAIVGHELKSRARVNVVEYNRFSNEADGIASREIDLPNGGQAYIIGNVIQQGPLGENSNLVGYGLEGLSNPGPHELYAINNTLVNEKTVGTYFHTPSTGLFFKAYNNILAGGGSFMAAWPTAVDTLANLRATSIASVGFADEANYDYHITTSSPAHSTAYPAGVANSGYPLVAWYEYVHPLGSVTRCQHATLDAGAFETCTTAIGPVLPTRESIVWPNPTDDLVNVAASQQALLLVMDALGRPVDAQSQRVGDGYQLDLSGLASGLYSIRVFEAGVVKTQRVVKR